MRGPRSRTYGHTERQAGGAAPALSGGHRPASFAIGDFSRDEHAELMIGIPYRDSGADADAGAIQVLYQSEFIFKDGFD